VTDHDEHGTTAQPLRRLPWTTEAGHPAYVPFGDGAVTRIAEAMEVSILESARFDARRARAVIGEPTTTVNELRAALRTLAHAVDDAVNVAELRGERLDSEEGIPQPLIGQAAREVGQCLRDMVADTGH